MPEEVLQIPLTAIRPNPYQPRLHISEAALEELAATIRRHGVVQPVLVRREGDSFVLVAGERRLRAAERAGLATIPAIVRELDERQMLEIALVENLQREEINPVDAARAYRRLAEEFGLTQGEIAHRTGQSRAAVTNAVRLLQLPPDVLTEVEEGRLSEGHARVLLMLPEAEDRRALSAHILRNGLSVRESERAAHRFLGRAGAVSRGTPLPTPHSDPIRGDLEERLRRRFATRARIDFQGRAGSITLEFYDDEDLARILELLGLDR